MKDVEDALMGVDALPEDQLDAMGSIMRLISAEVIRATSVGYWTPKPIAEAILALVRERDRWQLDAQAADLLAALAERGIYSRLDLEAAEARS